MTETTALALPDIATATLPALYARATEALTECSRIDECINWADKAAAIASYAKQADDPTLHKLATRIQARAVRRCGELLEQFKAPGARTDRPGGDASPRLPPTQREVAAAAGLSKDQEKQAVRVANVPAAEFEAAVESDAPPTITALAERGTEKRPKAPPPAGVEEATKLTGLLRELTLFGEQYHPRHVAQGLFPHEGPMLLRQIASVERWLHEFKHVLEARP